MTSRLYAERTSVPAERTRAEIERLLERHGATGFMFGTSVGGEGARALVAFEMQGYRLRFLIPMPSVSRKLTELHVKAETRRRWRALLLVIKAKLEAVASGIVEFRVEFLPFIVTSGSTTVADQVVPQLAELLAGGALPPLLGPGELVMSRDGLKLDVVARLDACDETELRAIDAQLRAIEHRRGAPKRQCSADWHWVNPQTGVCTLCERDRRADEGKT